LATEVLPPALLLALVTVNWITGHALD
jgi:hypothetical protein